MAFERIKAAVAAMAQGRMVILVDDEDRENEGDLVMAASAITPDAINFMATHARGLICLTMTAERLQALDIPQMVVDNDSPHKTAFTVSIEAKEGVSTGISAADRARTIAVAVNPTSTPADLTRPGHIFPLRARDGGVLVRRGHTEGSVDLARLAGLYPAGVICEVINADGTMARMPDLVAFGQKHDLPVACIAELIAYRLACDITVRPAVTQQVKHPRHGVLDVHVFVTSHDNRQHLAVVRGRCVAPCVPLVAVHGSESLADALKLIETPQAAAGRSGFERLYSGQDALLIVVDAPGADASLTTRVGRLGAALPDGSAGQMHKAQHAYRDGVGAQILRALQVSHMRLLACAQGQAEALGACGLVVQPASSACATSPLAQQAHAPTHDIGEPK